ncbi:MAG: hypothetical protein ACJ796_20835 [Gemmatimonadaceae bacterium]
MAMRVFWLVFALAALGAREGFAQQDSTKPARPAPRVPKPSSRATRHASPTTLAAWPDPPAPLPGSILPAHRIVAFYGNPLSRRMGVLAEQPVDSMLARLDREVRAWTEADSTTPAQPALHLIVSVAQGSPGRDGKYRQRADTAVIERVYRWARSRNALLFLDVQLGRSTLDAELPRLLPFLRRPDVHLGLDPEFAMGASGIPGTRIGTLDAREVNEAIDILADLVTTDSLPPKVLVVHRFTRDMLTHSTRIHVDPRVQVVINMDGWGPPWMKRESYRRYVARYPVEYTGFKLFYHNDTKAGDRLMTPAEILALFPRPLYIQYQ